MTYRHLLALALPLAVALPVSAAEWSDNAKTEFVQQCIAGAPAGYEEPQLRAYCDCAATKVSQEFSEAELQEISRQSPPDPTMQQRLVNASGSCSSKLKP
ncbi:hypothetical protein [Ectopseudomonas guguanensis]|uniref:Uncharacterized protein n=1 Tax=Ectopseudomonas guguanensis TaxID=1198456 RepID=A0A1H0T5Q6_9GAMM|nr:hypothetical protein [Pseudomonas guguanensis]SDP48918.1 hypothetical protein SAMN05216213_10475 [Pseudomonas guguanensis]